jgi:hypothetical protein
MATAKPVPISGLAQGWCDSGDPLQLRCLEALVQSVVYFIEPVKYKQWLQYCSQRRECPPATVPTARLAAR